MIEIKHRYTGAVLKTVDAANLGGADLRYADLRYADLRGANLSDADLSDANLIGADLRGANLRGANLRGANLRGANLRGANLRGANLSDADLRYADLRGAEGISSVIAAQLSIAPQGELIGWKKLKSEVICKVLIPASAARSNATGRKCRAQYVVVLEGEGISKHDGTTRYAPGLTVTCDEWCTDRWQECAGGIHFFLTREEAEAY